MPWSAVSGGLILVGLVWVGYASFDKDGFESALLVAPGFIAFGFLLAWLLGRTEASFDLRGIVLCGTGLRLILEVVRQGNGADSVAYNKFAVQLSASFRALQFSVDTQRDFPGTGFLRYLTGLVQVFTFDDRYATFMVFTAFSLVGSAAFYLAFARAVPTGNRYRYAVLIFLWPSMAYWPSSIGKEAWMLLWIGVGSYGTARILTGKTLTGFAIVVTGLLATAMVRPHVSLMMLAATAVAILVRRPQTVRSVVGGRNVVRRIGGGAKVLAVVLVLFGGGILATQTQKVLKLEDGSTDNVGAGLSVTEAQTSQGGSAFTPFTVRNPANYPPALVTVVFRPFPFEARSSEAMQSAAEGMVLMVLLFLSIPRLARLPSTMRRQPYIAYAVSMVLVFVYAFSAVGNFGILARQRTQALPLVFVLVCLPPVARAVKDHRSAESTFRGSAVSSSEPPEDERSIDDPQNRRPRLPTTPPAARVR